MGSILRKGSLQLLSGVLGIFLLIQSQPASAQYLTELALFQRCYMQITSTRARTDNLLYQQVKSGQKKAIDACVQVLRSSNFTANGNETIADANNPEEKNVLSTFHRLHASWFGSRDFPVLGQIGHNRDEKNLYDSSTPALYITRALFNPNAQAKSIVTLNAPLTAYRTENDPPKAPDTGHAKTDYFFTPVVTFAAMGELLGVHQPGSVLSSFPATKQNKAGSIDLQRTLGGGVVGSTPYLLMNMADMTDDFMTDGGVKMHRRWGKAVFKDLLCREMPVVRESDVVGLVDVNSSIPFRNSAACTKCHASQDRLASVVRNMKVINLGDAKGDFGVTARGGIFPDYWTTTLGAEASWPTTPDPDYSKRPTNGTFYFRSFSGELIEKPLVSVQDIGQKISETDDFYVCLAKRYYKYFIGIDINNGDLADPGWSYKLTTGDQYHRDVVIGLGKSLKTHQSLSRLVEDILRLDNYRKYDFGIGSTGK